MIRVIKSNLHNTLLLEWEMLMPQESIFITVKIALLELQGFYLFICKAISPVNRTNIQHRMQNIDSALYWRFEIGGSKFCCV